MSRDTRHHGEVLHKTTRLALGSLRWTHFTPLRVMELTRTRQLAVFSDRRIYAPEVRQRARVRESVQYLRNTCTNVLRPDTPVPGTKRIFDTVRDDFRLQNVIDVEYFTRPQRLGTPAEKLLVHTSKQLPE